MQSSFDMSVEFEAAFSKRVREQRLKFGLSQRALSEALSERGLKIDPSGITRLEKAAERGSDRRGIRLGEAVVIASELEIDIAGLAAEFDVPETRLREMAVEFARSVNLAQTSIATMVDSLTFILDLLNARPELFEAMPYRSTDEYLAAILANFDSGPIGEQHAIPIYDARQRAAVKKIVSAMAKRVVVGPKDLGEA